VARGSWHGLTERVRHAIATSSDAPVNDPSEIVVHQAIGITMETVGCSNLVALDALVGLAEQRGHPLVAVAVGLVQRQADR
jgi:hypothetical protein